MFDLVLLGQLSFSFNRVLFPLSLHMHEIFQISFDRDMKELLLENECCSNITRDVMATLFTTLPSFQLLNCPLKKTQKCNLNLTLT